MFPDDILGQHPGPITGDVADKVAQEVGAHFKNLTGALHDAREALRSLGNDTKLVDEDGKPCNVTCIVDKTKKVVGHAGKTTRKSLLKLGLRKLHAQARPSSTHSVPVGPPVG